MSVVLLLFVTLFVPVLLWHKESQTNTACWILLLDIQEQVFSYGGIRCFVACVGYGQL